MTHTHTHKERKKWCRITAGNEPRIYRSPSGGCGCGCGSRIFLRRASTTGFSYWVFLLIWLYRTGKEEEQSSARLKATKCHKLRCFSVSWHMQINLLYIVDPVHWVLYPLPSRRQLWAQKTHRITPRIPIIADVHVCGAYLLLGLFCVASDKIIIIIILAKRTMQHKVLKQDVMSCVDMSDIMTESLVNYQETSRLSAVFHLKTLAKLWKTDAALQSV